MASCNPSDSIQMRHHRRNGNHEDSPSPGADCTQEPKARGSALTTILAHRIQSLVGLSLVAVSIAHEREKTFTSVSSVSSVVESMSRDFKEVS